MARYIILCLILIYFLNILKALISIDTDHNLILEIKQAFSTLCIHGLGLILI